MLLRGCSSFRLPQCRLCACGACSTISEAAQATAQAPFRETFSDFSVAAAALNVRDAPDGRLVGRATRGNTLHVYETTDEWARVSARDEAPRWVSRKGFARAPDAPRASVRPARNRHHHRRQRHLSLELWSARPHHTAPRAPTTAALAQVVGPALAPGAGSTASRPGATSGTSGADDARDNR